MKLWAELTMSLQKVETKSSMENDGNFSSRLCRGAGTSPHSCPLVTHPDRGHPTPSRLGRAGCSALGSASPSTQRDVPGLCSSPRRVTKGPWGDHPALGPSPSPRAVPLGWDHPPVAETMGAEQPRCRGRCSPGSLSVPWILGRRGSLLFLKHPCWNPLGCSLPLAPNIFRQPLARSNQQTGNK